VEGSVKDKVIHVTQAGESNFGLILLGILSTIGGLFVSISKVVKIIVQLI